MQCTIYIRGDNEEAWKAIENKSEWVNNMLGHPLMVISSSDVPMTLDNPSMLKKVPLFDGTPVITPRNKDMDFCKHGAVKGLCKKGCK